MRDPRVVDRPCSECGRHPQEPTAECHSIGDVLKYPTETDPDRVLCWSCRKQLIDVAHIVRRLKDDNNG